MSPIPEDKLKELAKLACDRARLAVETITNRLDDNDTAAVMMIVAADCITGSAYHFYNGDDDLSEEDALTKTLHGVLVTLGVGSD